jgi:ubiquinone/menaquinone biosynthesis C-methylase UbiE
MSGSIYNANDPVAYERSMGRWSHRLASLFIDFAVPPENGKILDVGCGTGSLVFALAKAAPEAAVTGVDYSQAFVDYARAQSTNPRLCFERGDAAALPYGDGEFNAVLSLLVLNFIPDAERAAREMKRVTRPGGMVAASVWDFRGGLTFLRVFADTAAVLDPSGQAFRFPPHSPAPANSRRPGGDWGCGKSCRPHSPSEWSSLPSRTTGNHG